MKRLLLLALLASGLPLMAQNVRWDGVAMNTQGVGQALPVQALPGVHVTFYSCTGLSCITPAQTYQSATDTTGCPSGTQVVWQPTVSIGCVSTADSKGRFGGWFQPGLYQYVLSGPGVINGPSFFSIGTSTGATFNCNIGTNCAGLTTPNTFTNANNFNGAVTIGTATVPQTLLNYGLVESLGTSASLVAGPTGIATNLANYQSSGLLAEDSYWGGSSPGATVFGVTVLPGTGINPATTAQWNFVGCPSGNCNVNFAAPVVHQYTTALNGNTTVGATANLTLAGITGATVQCAQFSPTGILGGTGTPCGSGGGGGSPAGPPTSVQINTAGAFGSDSTFVFYTGSHQLQTLNLILQANGVATSTNNQASGQNSLEANVWNGSVGTAIYYDDQVYVGTGANPYSLLDHRCSVTGTTSTCLSNFDYPINADSGSLTAIADAQYFRAYGDALQLADGCNTTASSTTVYCPDAPFTSTAVDAGKLMCVRGAGAAGVGFCPAIVTVTDSSHVVVNAAAGTSVTQSPQNAVYGHDDTAQIQACLQYSASNAIECRLKPQPEPSGQNGLIGFLVASAPLQLVADNADVEGSASSLSGGAAYGTNLFCEYNGDCLTNAAGPIQGATVTNISLQGDPSQPSGRGMHLNAQAGSYGNGGVWNSTFTNMLVNNFALECMLSEGGGGVGYTYVLPIQIDTFSQFQCDGPNQMHTAALIKMTGQHAQIIFQNGQVNGNGPNAGNNSWTYYPNPMIDIEPGTGPGGPSSPGGVTPVDVKFYGYTYEVGTQGLKVGDGGLDIHYDNGYVENVGTPLIAGGANGVHLTYSGNHIANSGNITGIAQFTGNVTGGMRDNFEYGGLVTAAALAACTGNNNQVDFSSNVSTSNTISSCNTGSNQATAIGAGSVQADNTPVVPVGADPTGATDSRAAIQAAITSAISQNKEVYIPGGTYIVSCPTPNSSTPALTAPTSNFRMRGAGSQAGVSTPLTTSITATAACPILNIGTGTVTSAQPGGYFRDIQLTGHGKPAVGSPNGYYALSVNGIPGFEVSSNYFGSIDIGLEFEGDSFGSVVSNNWITFGSTNAGIYVPVGSSSGSDISFHDNWVNGAFCGFCITASGGIHIENGQVGAGQGTSGTNDNAGAIVLNYDYPTGSLTGTTGPVNVVGTSFEGTQGTWIFRNYGQSYLTTNAIAMNPEGPAFFPTPVAAAIGVYKGTNMQFSQTAFRDTQISGYWSNPQLISTAGSFASNTGFLFAESNTQIAAQAPTINGVLVFAAMADASGNRWTTMMGQSGLQSSADVNDQSGPLIGGFRPVTTPTPMQLGDTAFGTGTQPNVASILPGNNSATDQVYVSHGITIATGTKSCSHLQSGSSSASTCNVSSSPAVNETWVCAVSSSSNPQDLIAVDENGNVFNNLGPLTTFSDTTGYMQLAYHTYTSTPSPTISTITGFPNTPTTNIAIQCQQLVGTTFANPLDGSISVANASSGNLTGSSITTTQANDYLMCGGFNGTGSSSLGAGSGFTAGAAIGGNYLAQYQLKASAGSISPTMTWSGTGGAGMVCAAIKMQSVVAPSLENAPAISGSNITGVCNAAGCAVTGGLISVTNGAVGIVQLVGSNSWNLESDVSNNLYMYDGSFATTPFTVTPASAYKNFIYGNGLATIGWSSDPEYANNAVPDTGFSRDSAGVVDCGNGTQGDKSCNLNLASINGRTVPLSNAITSATGGSGISAVTCTTASCTNLRGTYTMTATTVSAGATILTLVWPTTTTAYACIVSQNGGTLAIAPSHSVATTTGMTIATDLAITSGSIGIDYSCQP